MTERMTSMLMGVVTVVVTTPQMVKDSDERTELMILQGISTAFFIAMSKNKYCYITSETAGSPLTYTSIML